jgi:hypothetical protein
VKPAERSAAGYLVGHTSHAFGKAGARIAADDQQVRRYLRQLGDLAVEYGPSFDDERALVAPVEAGGPAAGQDCTGP